MNPLLKMTKKRVTSNRSNTSPVLNRKSNKITSPLVKITLSNEISLVSDKHTSRGQRKQNSRFVSFFLPPMAFEFDPSCTSSVAFIDSGDSRH